MPKWRSLPLGKKLLKIGADDGDTIKNRVQPTQFLSFHEHGTGIHGSTTVVPGAQPEDRHMLEREAFLDHSIAFHEDLQSSQLAPPEPMEETTFISSMSFDSNLTDASNFASEASLLSGTPDGSSPQQPVTFSGAITELKRIPNADHIHRIQPQTITVNLLIGVISISPSRAVKLRRSNRSMDIIEVLAGDETRGGFSISFWLASADSQHKPADDLREDLKALRSGDVVLLQGIALSEFRGSVFGQSLSRRISKNSTIISILHRSGSGGGPVTDGRPVSFAAKLKRVQDWVTSFVGPTRKRHAAGGGCIVAHGGKRGRTEDPSLPPESPEKHNV